MRKLLVLASIMFGAMLGSSKNMNAAEVQENPVDRGLSWLVKHQEPDGHWNARKWSAAKETDTAVTSFALLALLGAGHSEKVGEYRDNVRRCVAWLKSKQVDTTDAGGIIDEAHGVALASLALAEATGMANVPATREVAQKVFDRCVEIFPFKKTIAADGKTILTIDETADTPTVGWCVMAWKSARVAGLKVQPDAFDALVGYLDSVEHKLQKMPEDDVAPSEYWFRKQEQIGDGHPSYRVSAIACLSRQFLGGKREALRSSVAHFIKQSGVPAWNKNGENVDLYYWWPATLCAFQQGNAGYVHIEPQVDELKIWQTWSEAKSKAITENQCKDGDDAGSWNAQGFASREWGRVGQTALGCLSMEVYYRYMQVAHDLGK